MSPAPVVAPVELPSLEEVRRAIPARCYERSLSRGLAMVAVDVALWVAVLAATVLAPHPLLGLAGSVLAGIGVSALFVLGHDAAHDALLPSERLNRVVALVLMLPSLHVRDGWVFGHNRVHHGFTVRRGTDFVWHPVTPQEFAAMSRARRLLHRVEWSIPGSGLYYLRVVWWSKMIRFTPPERSAPGVRRDRRIIGAHAVLASALAAGIGWARSGSIGGAVWMWLLLVVIPFLVFCWVIGATVKIHHVQPDLHWYEGRDWTRSKAQLVGTTVLRMPKLVDLAMHHIFVHVPHHVDARIPCYRLNDATAAIEVAFPGIVADRPYGLREFVRASRACLLYDFDRGCWQR